jgi:DNA polymerase-3 subunit epsilon
MTWWEESITGFDLETTGIDVRTDRIVQWCVADTLPGHPPVVDSEYVNPGVPIPPGATTVHSITDDYVARYGNPAAESIRRLVEAIAYRMLARMPIGGMNLAYDFTLLRYECERYGVPWVEERAGRPLAPIIDTYVLDKHLDPYRKGSRQLPDGPKGPGMATHYGVILEGAHDAVADTIASVEVSRVIGRRGAADHNRVGEPSKYRLHLLQTDWRAEQSASLEAYFRRKGEPKRIDPCWPYCPDPDHVRN